jgi:class 3 adenylate cyclase
MRAPVTDVPTGTVTIVVAEGRRMMRLARELAPDEFDALLEEFQRLLRHVLESMGGREVDLDSDTAMAVFMNARQAALAAVAAQRAVAAHEWPHGRELAMSVGVDSGPVGVGRVGPVVVRCEELCDAAEGGEIFVTQTASSLLEAEDLGDLELRDRGEVQLRRSDQKIRAYELVMPAE